MLTILFKSMLTNNEERVAPYSVLRDARSNCLSSKFYAPDQHGSKNGFLHAQLFILPQTYVHVFFAVYGNSILSLRSGAVQSCMSDCMHINSTTIYSKELSLHILDIYVLRPKKKLTFVTSCPTHPHTLHRTHCTRNTQACTFNACCYSGNENLNDFCLTVQCVCGGYGVPYHFWLFKSGNEYGTADFCLTRKRSLSTF